MKILLILLFILTINSISCSDDNLTSSDSDDLVEVQFDLQTGFNNVSVSIMENDKYYFNSILSGIAPLAGPQASFITYLEKGEHRFITRRTQLDNITDSEVDTTLFNIGDSNKYWIGMSIYSDSLYFVIQDSGFFYF